jgi:prevent-host-death family protein
MKSIGAYQAKTHLYRLLDRVAEGEQFMIARHGVPMAWLVPVRAVAPKLTHEEIVEGMRALRKRVKPGKLSLREMIALGRRF